MGLKIATLDLETYGFKTYKRFCNPLDPNHFVVANCYKIRGQEAVVEYNENGIKPDEIFDNLDLENIDILVGQNFKFDMLWFWSSKRFQDWLRSGGRVWDTMMVEFMLRGQQGVSHGAKDDIDSLSLDALSKKYGGTLKDKEVKVAFADGQTVLDLDKDVLIEYGKEDVRNTELVFVAQYHQAKKLNMLPLISVHNDHLLAITEAEYNGMYFDGEGAKKRSNELLDELNKIASNISGLLVKHKLWPEKDSPFKLTSSKQLATLLFGGMIKVTKRIPLMTADGEQAVFKSGKNVGKLRFKNDTSEVYIPGLGEEFLDKWETESGGKGTSDDVLSDLKSITSNDITKEIISSVLEYRAIAKVRGTYLYKFDGKKESGLVPLIHPDGCIHSEYQMCGTKTLRLASSSPNLQNVPPTVTDLFKSRFGDDGVMMELDFSQLEVVVQAYLTQCVKMIEDIESGLDFHCMRLAYAVDKEYDEVVELCENDKEWKTKRSKVAKPISFQKAYGAQPESIARGAGIPLEVVKLVFDKEDERYPEINKFYEGMVEELNRTARETHRKMQVKVNGVMKYHKTKKEIIGQWTNINGKIYTFTKKAVKTKKGIFEYWSMPDVMNYPIQGTAADIVAMMTGRVFRFLLNHRDKALLVNEIHDSNILDVKKEHAEFIKENLLGILGDVKTAWREKYGIEFNAPISVDANYADNWKDAK